MMRWINKSLMWHIAIWLLYFIVNFYDDIFNKQWSASSLYHVFSYFFLIVFTFYFYYLLVAPKFLKREKLLFVFLFFFVFILIKFINQEVLFPWLFDYPSRIHDWRILEYIHENLFIAFVPAAAGTLLFLFDQKSINEANALKLLNERNEAELSFLRSQINPHFLFNTLSFLHTKAYKLDGELAESILRLSDVLRYSLKNSKLEKTTISEEIDLMKGFIGIYKDRFGENCFV